MNKRVFYLLMISIIFCVQARAQNALTTYDTCSTYQNFAGLWMYANGQDTIKIHLRAHRFFSQSLNTVMDALRGWQEVKQGSVVIHSDFANRFMTLTFDNVEPPGMPTSSLLLRTNACSTSATQILGSLIDISNNRQFNTFRATVASFGNQLHCRLEITPFSDNTNMTLPKSFILVKQ